MNHSPVLTVDSDGKILYAICVEKINRRSGKVIPDIIYVHAANVGEARWIFAQDPDYRQFKIIAVAPAVGYFVADNHGDVLIA